MQAIFVRALLSLADKMGQLPNAYSVILSLFLLKRTRAENKNKLMTQDQDREVSNQLPSLAVQTWVGKKQWNKCSAEIELHNEKQRQMSTPYPCSHVFLWIHDASGSSALPSTVWAAQRNWRCSQYITFSQLLLLLLCTFLCSHVSHPHAPVWALLMSSRINLCSALFAVPIRK